MQEVVDTPDGKPTAEWLIFRKHTPYLLPLEETEEWGDTFQVNPKFTCFASFTSTKVQILAPTRLPQRLRQDSALFLLYRCKSTLIY